MKFWLLLCALVFCVPNAARAQPAAEFYKTRMLTLAVSDAAGGGYDIMARAVAKYLGNHLPGNPRIVVQNMPGAGGIVAMNYLYTTAPKDGSVIGAVHNNTPFEPPLGTPQATYDPGRLHRHRSPAEE